MTTESEKYIRDVRTNAKACVSLALKELGYNASDESLEALAIEYMNKLHPHPYCIIIMEEE